MRGIFYAIIAHILGRVENASNLLGSVLGVLGRAERSYVAPFLPYLSYTLRGRVRGYFHSTALNSGAISLSEQSAHYLNV